MVSDAKLRILKDKANKLPLTPGVYIMKNAKGDVIYVGKAKALKNRVTQYFGSHLNHTAKVIKMVENVDEFETILCDTEYEALMLENSLIKQHQPKYNILLKDDKGYHYIKVTEGKWPLIEATKNLLKDKAEYIGPYYSGYVVKNTVDETLKIFKLPTCKRSFDKKSKVCLNYHIGLCSAPCIGKIGNKEYIETVRNAVSYIKGGTEESDIEAIEAKMNKAAENLDFEYAARLRDRIAAIKRSKEKQKVIISNHKRQDIFAISTAGEEACINILIFREGHLVDKKHFYLDGAIKKSEYYPEFFQQYYQDLDDIPPEIAIDIDFEEIALFESWLTELRGGKVTISIPQRGQQKQLVEMCLSNAAQELSHKLERSGKETAAISELADLLGLDKAPVRIESYDISNTAGSENVGSMVVFINGRATKSLYRKFKIKSFMGQDDFRSLNEVLDRRFAEYMLGKDESFKTLPDLILLDGGRGQLSAVVPIIQKYGLNIPIFGMVKDSKHKTRAITDGGEDIHVKANRKAFTLVNLIQEEVHRVAISYHHQRQKANTLQLELTKIEGVGPKTAEKLLKTFKTVKKIKEADLDTLKSAGVTEKVAVKIIEYFN